MSVRCTRSARFGDPRYTVKAGGLSKLSALHQRLPDPVQVIVGHDPGSIDGILSLKNGVVVGDHGSGCAVGKDINGKTYPQVCDVTESADGLTVTVKLRERYFSNGDKITMEDVLASIQRGAALLTESSFKKQWNGVTMKVDQKPVSVYR